MDRNAPLTDAEVATIHRAIHALNDPPGEFDPADVPDVAFALQQLLEVRGLL